MEMLLGWEFVSQTSTVWSLFAVGIEEGDAIPIKTELALVLANDGGTLASLPS
jgi:hypothetical protein